jgi:hypothetical protein
MIRSQSLSRCTRPTPRERAGAAATLLVVLGICQLALVGCATRGKRLATHPFPGVVCYVETRHDPPLQVFVAKVSLRNPNVHIRVAPGGPDPDGSGPWQTTLLEPTRIAAREGFELVVNGDFFDARGVKDAEGTNSTYRAEGWGAANGPAVTDGKIWSICNTSAWPCLVIHRDRRVTIEELDRPGPDAWEVVAGNTMLVENGLPVPHQSKRRHPRTVVGLDAERSKLVIMVVDGRRPGISIGMTYDELAAEMIRLGCRQAINLDGGGSSVMAVRDPATGALRILNHPSDGHERPVAEVLGISAGARP